MDEIEVKMRVLDNNAALPANPTLTGAVDSSDSVHSESDYVPVRLIASSSTGGWLTREAYREYLDPVTGQTLNYCALDRNAMLSNNGTFQLDYLSFVI